MSKSPRSPQVTHGDDDNSELVRLSKLMSERGLCSRREADEWIAKGWVFVNGLVVDQLGSKFARTVRITLATEALKEQKNLMTIALNKPVGYVSSTPEDGHPHALSLITPENQWVPTQTSLSPQTKSKISRNPQPRIPQAGKLYSPQSHIQTLQDLKGFTPAGRLDIDSQGLIIFTQDGRLAKKLLSSFENVEKEYSVRVVGQITRAKIERLRHGLELEGQPLKPAEVHVRSQKDEETTHLLITLTEGKKRQIRRMCELVELKVIFLKRVRIGKLQLGDLPTGKWKHIQTKDIV